MADIVTNVLVFLGVYNLIAVIWRAVEVVTMGRAEVKTEHTFICWIISAVIMVLLYLWRI